MNLPKKHFLTLTIFLLTLSFSSTSHAYGWGWGWSWIDTKPKNTITEIVSQSGGDFDRNFYDYDILLNAVLAADLASFLSSNDQNLTVFAPNDLAFIRLARNLGYDGHDEQGAFNAIVSTLTELGEGDPIPLLTSILSYHVLPKSLTLRQVVRSKNLETALDGATILSNRYALIDNEPELRNPYIVFRNSNIRASNGIVHTISRVLIPLDLDNTPDSAKTITDIVASSGGEFDHNYHDFDLLLNAVIAADLGNALATLDNLTVFAPTDAAFVRLARTLGYRGYNEEKAFNFIVATLTELGDGDPIPLLTSVLQYHVSNDALSLTEITSSEEISTLLEGAVITPKGNRLKDLDAGVRDPRLIIRKGDLRASNGLIQPINRVLLPLAVSELIH